MLNNILKSISFLAVLSIVLFTAGTLNAQDKPDSCSMHKEGMMHKSGDNKMMNHEMKEGDMHDHSKMMEEENSIVREGAIDLAAIDEDGDGKVYQDQMCWNVVSDGSGECPQCGMILKEVTLEDAQKNLEENDFEVK